MAAGSTGAGFASAASSSRPTARASLLLTLSIVALLGGCGGPPNNRPATADRLIGAYNDYAARVDLSSNELERCSSGLAPGSAPVFACIRLNSRSLRELLANFDKAIAAIKFPDDVKADIRRLGEADNRLGSLYETLALADSPPSPAVRAALRDLRQGGADQKTAVENLARDLRAKR